MNWQEVKTPEEIKNILTEHLQKREKVLCLCGCGCEVNIGRKYIIGHWLKQRTGIHFSEITKNKMKEARKKQILPLRDSSIEVKIQNFLKEINLKFYKHYWINIKHGYHCDILIPSINLIIECDGDYWHCNPKRFINPNEWQLKKIEEDKIRTEELIEKGFKVLRLWEMDINKINLEDFLIILKKFN
jgi:very-short-patch-repair endonuclease